MCPSTSLTVKRNDREAHVNHTSIMWRPSLGVYSLSSAQMIQSCRSLQLVPMFDIPYGFWNCVARAREFTVNLALILTNPTPTCLVLLRYYPSLGIVIVLRVPIPVQWFVWSSGTLLYRGHSKRRTAKYNDLETDITAILNSSTPEKKHQRLL